MYETILVSVMLNDKCILKGFLSNNNTLSEEVSRVLRVVYYVQQNSSSLANKLVGVDRPK